MPWDDNALKGPRGGREGVDCPRHCTKCTVDCHGNHGHAGPHRCPIHDGEE